MASDPGFKQPLTIDTNHGSMFKVGPRFVDLNPIGIGANGVVVSGIDSDCDKQVAIKKLTFKDAISCKYVLREVSIMRSLKHENVVSVFEILGEGGVELDSTCDLQQQNTNIFIVQELLHTDLYRLIKNCLLTEEHIKLFMYQLLKGLKYIHSANVLHRDLKPNNLLIDCENLVLKIGDFGMARVVDPNYDHSGFLSGNVGNCWYRSPDILLDGSSYTKATDLWSVGCIFAEMFTGHTLFPGAQEIDQMCTILDTIELTDGDWDHVLHILPNKCLKNHPLKVRKPLEDRMGDIGEHALDLLTKLLIFDPSPRVTAKEALQHPYFSIYACPKDEPIAQLPFHIEAEVDSLSPTTLKKVIFKSSKSFHSCGSCIDSADLLKKCSCHDQTPDNGFDDWIMDDVHQEITDNGMHPKQESSLEMVKSKAEFDSSEELGAAAAKDIKSSSLEKSLNEANKKFIDLSNDCMDELAPTKEMEDSDLKIEDFMPKRKLGKSLENALREESSKDLRATYKSEKIFEAFPTVYSSDIGKEHSNATLDEDVEMQSEQAYKQKPFVAKPKEIEKAASDEKDVEELSHDMDNDIAVDAYILPSHSANKKINEADAPDENTRIDGEDYLMKDCEKELCTGGMNSNKKQAMLNDKNKHFENTFDELYRLPTAHLIRDRDRVNERIKRQKDSKNSSTKLHHQINERLKLVDQGADIVPEPMQPCLTQPTVPSQDTTSTPVNRQLRPNSPKEWKNAGAIPKRR